MWSSCFTTLLCLLEEMVSCHAMPGGKQTECQSGVALVPVVKQSFSNKV